MNEDDTDDFPVNAALVVSSNGHETSRATFQAAGRPLQIYDKGGRNGFNNLDTAASAKEIEQAEYGPPD